MAFTIKVRKMIGERDDWTCKGHNCGCLTALYVLERMRPVKFDDGFMVTAAHYPDKHQKEDDGNPGHGRILCTLYHAWEEYLRDNMWGTKQLLEMGVYTVDYHRKHGVQWYPTVDELLTIGERFADKRLIDNIRVLAL